MYNSELNILKHVIGIPFYKRHYGILLIAFLLLFGVVSPQVAMIYHLALMDAMIQTPVLVLVAAIVWMLYALRCIQIGLNLLALPENEFLYTVSLLPVRRQLFILFCTQVFIYLPVLLYCATLCALAIFKQAYLSAALVLVLNFLLCLSVTIVFFLRIKHQNRAESSSKISQSINHKFTKSYPAIFLSYLISQEKIAFLFTKIISIIIIVATIPIYKSVDYQERMLWIGYLLSGVTHIMMVQLLRNFEEGKLLITRNLPISYLKRFLIYALVYAVILVPEILILARSLDTFSISQISGYYILTVGICLLGHCILFINGLEQKYINRMFFVFIILFVLIMYSVHPVFLGSGLALLGFFFLYKNFYAYEWLPLEALAGKAK